MIVILERLNPKVTVSSGFPAVDSCRPLHWPVWVSLQEWVFLLPSPRSHSIYSHAHLLMSFATGLQFRWQGGQGLTLSVRVISVVSSPVSVSVYALLASLQLFLSISYLWYGGLCRAQCVWSLCLLVCVCVCTCMQAFNFVWCTWACVISQLP